MPNSTTNELWGDGGRGAQAPMKTRGGEENARSQSHPQESSVSCQSMSESSRSEMRSECSLQSSRLLASHGEEHLMNVKSWSPFWLLILTGFDIRSYYYYSIYYYYLLFDRKNAQHGITLKMSNHIQSAIRKGET